MIPLKNTTTGFGWVSIVLHWTSAVSVAVLYFLGERMEDAPSRADHIAARQLHVSVGALLFTVLAIRLIWSVSQRGPAPLERNRWLRLAATAVQRLFLLMIAVLVVTGPLTIWAAARPIEVFDLFALPSPFPVRVEWLHELSETVHGAATKAFWPLLALHVAGALKHLVVDRDGTLQRMLWPAR